MFNKIKSPETLFNSTPETLLNLVLVEQRHQRADLATIKRQLHSLITDLALQKQVDDYMDETSPQTDTGEQTGNQNS